MNFHLPNIPERTEKPRKSGITMVMDKGLSLRETEDLINRVGNKVDLVKLGFGSAIVTSKLREKLKLFKDAGIQPYFGGTLFEAFIVRKMFDDFCKLIDKFQLEVVEVSDGSVIMPNGEKCEYIRKLSKQVQVLSEVGSKDEGFIISHPKWLKMMKNELDAGAWKIITESRESGTVGIYRPTGKARVVLVNKILKQFSAEKVIWEAPKKQQQVWFIKHIGANVNLGNIAPEEVIALESLRLGLRGDTFFTFLNKK